MRSPLLQIDLDRSTEVTAGAVHADQNGVVDAKLRDGPRSRGVTTLTVSACWSMMVASSKPSCWNPNKRCGRGSILSRPMVAGDIRPSASMTMIESPALNSERYRVVPSSIRT